MKTQALTKNPNTVPDETFDLFKPWSEWFDNTNALADTMNIPAVNFTEKKDKYEFSLAVPGLKKGDFKVDVDGNTLNISTEKEEKTEKIGKGFTRKEYNYSSFNRSFLLPEEVNKDKIKARYDKGVLKVSLPRREEAKKNNAKKVAVH